MEWILMSPAKGAISGLNINYWRKHLEVWKIVCIFATDNHIV